MKSMWIAVVFFALAAVFDVVSSVMNFTIDRPGFAVFYLALAVVWALAAVAAGVVTIRDSE